MTAADYTPYLQGGRELGQQQGQNIGGISGTGTSLPLSEYLYSNNSLNITTQQPVEKGAQTPQQVDTPNSLKSSKTTQLGTPTAMTDLLAMLDDNTAFSDMVQQQEERQWDIERHRNKFTTQLSSATTSGDTTTTTDLSPQVLMQQELPMNMVSRSASAGLLEAVGDKQTPLMPLQQQTEQQFINPNLLNNGGGVNSSLFVDDGFLEEPVGACNGSGNQLIIDEVALSPDIQRRMSEVVTGSIPQQNHSRGSISHQIDFWNLSNDRQSISSGHSTSGRTANNSIDLMSFKKSPTPNIATAGTSITNTSATTLPTVTAGSTNTVPTTTNSSKSNSANNSNGAAPPSVFKIDNELTQLLNDYNIDFSAPSKPSHTPTTRLRASSYVPHTKTNTVTTSSSTGNILSSAAAAAAAAVATSATNAVPSVSTSRRSNSISEPQNRVQKQRTSVSLIDGNNPVIMDKLYGDVNNISKFSQWENAIISDEEDHEEKSTNRQPDPKVTLATATVGSKFISPAMLNQDLLENKSFEVRNTSAISTNGISASTRRKRASIPKGPRGTNSKSSSPLEEEEKPFKCQECTKAFRRSEHLKRHIRSVHSTDRPFPCTYCDKKFSRSDNLSQHLKTHRKHGDIKDILPVTSLKKG